MKTIWLAACAACVLMSATASAQMNAGGTTQPMMQQPMPAQMAMASNGPLTRDQVRADLARARADGTIPRFGNPDPYGPARSARNSPSMYPGR
ncbi:DUF4148 domain-containing protein [Caballeronia insecticola]|uniref:DUF4148 domain-containing protein n=1 Tax=Caballeronia insecticola TaxID=758793 RepID=R4WKA6_9BURK|nr:DUF4148 domain-containing protein [Caballeronia insecticola]BAN24978.1 putative uncharacterized protein [Caballeronia insecticola]